MDPPPALKGRRRARERQRGGCVRRPLLSAAGRRRNSGAAHFVHLRPTPAVPSLYRGAETDLVREYEARAATFRRLAGELRNEGDRAALLAIVAEYEAQAARLKKGPRA